MKVLAANPNRLYDLPGQPGAARRPVDVDASSTGFTNLRSLRLYRFESGAVVDGHAEEDEVFVVVTSGCVEIKLGWEHTAADAEGVHTLTAPSEGAHPFAVYMPPHSVYQLRPHTTADIAYARSTPVGGRPPKVFAAAALTVGEGLCTLLDTQAYAERLTLSVVRWQAGNTPVDIDLPSAADQDLEALVLVQGSPAENLGTICADGTDPMNLQSWQTLAFHPSEHATLLPAPQADLLILTVRAA